MTGDVFVRTKPLKPHCCLRIPFSSGPFSQLWVPLTRF